MPNILDLIASDAGPSEISDAIKDALYAKSSEKHSGRSFVQKLSSPKYFLANLDLGLPRVSQYPSSAT